MDHRLRSTVDEVPAGLPSISPSAATRATIVGVPPAVHSAGRATETAALAGLDQISAVVERELARSSQSAPSAESDGEDAESLESYLGRFMERMTGNKPQPASATSTGPAATQQTAEAIRQAFQSAKQAPRETLPPPECREQLAALRVLANQNAHNALILHACRGLKVRARVMFVAAVVVSLFSCVLAALAILGNSFWAQIGSAAAGALALVLACRLLRLYREHRCRAAEFRE